MNEDRITLVAALGNPGKEYAETRHNIAWNLLEYLEFYEELQWSSKFNALYCVKTIGENKIYFIKPMTYMNRSGDCISALIKYFKIPIEEILIIHDELELPFGTVSLKNGGGLAGHNGLRSIVANIGTRDFLRFRLGISKPSGNITDFVLGNFNSNEREILPEILGESAKIIEQILYRGYKNYEKKYKKLKIIE